MADSESKFAAALNAAKEFFKGKKEGSIPEALTDEESEELRQFNARIATATTQSEREIVFKNSRYTELQEKSVARSFWESKNNAA